jgi:trans-aconitate methyltransferase
VIGPSARFFGWVQGADFYVELHREAVALVPRTGGRWLDVGCGPGLVARLAADAGFDTLGIDRDAGMVLAARHQNQGRSQPRFEVGDLDTIAPASADVVSATSLLAAVPDARLAAARLWEAVRPGGTLLVVETTDRMQPTQARLAAAGVAPHRRSALAVWSRARLGRAVDLAALSGLEASTSTTTPLLDGLVVATVLEKDPQ